MSLIVFFVFAVLFWTVRVHVTNKVMRSMMYVYLSYWLLAITVSVTNPYGYYGVSLKSYVLLILNVISFTIGVLACRKTSSNSFYYDQKNTIKYQIEGLIDNKLFLTLLIISDIILIYLYIRFSVLLANYSAVDVRTNADLLFEGNSFLSLTYNLFLNPFCSIIMLLGAYLIVYNRKRILLLVLMGLFVFLFSEVTVSRLSIFRFLLCVIFVLFCRSVITEKSNKRRFSVGRLLGVTVSVLLVFSVLSFMTAQRNHGVNSFSLQAILIGIDDLLRDFTSYSVGPFRAFDHAVNTDYITRFGGYQYGRCTFGFVDCFFELIVRRLGIGYNSAYSKVISVLQNEWVDIGSGNTFNFAYTAVFTHYVDLGYVGVVLFPFLFGFVFNSFVIKFEKTQNAALLILLSFFFYVAVFTVFSWRLDRHNSTFLFIYLYIIYRSIEKKRINKQSEI